MEATDVSARIEDCCGDLEELVKEIQGFVKQKKVSTAKMLYRKAMEKATRTLIADGNPVGTVKMLSEGACAAEEGKVIEAEIEWKALNVRLEARKAILNGWQSVNRHLSIT